MSCSRASRPSSPRPIAATCAFLLAALALGGVSRAQSYPVSGPFEEYVASDVEDFLLTSDGARAVYRADQAQIGVTELFGVATSGGPSARLNGALPAGSDVLHFQLSPDDQWVAFVVTNSVTYNVWSARVDAAGTATLISSGNQVAPSATSFGIDPSSTHVVYADSVGGRLHSRAIDGSSPRVQLSFLGAGLLEFRFSGDGSYVVYEIPFSGRSRIYGVPVDGSLPEVELSTLSTGNSVLVGVHQDTAYFLDRGTNLFYASPVDGSAPPTALSAPTPAGTPFEGVLSHDGGTILTRAGAGLYSIATDGSDPVPDLLAQGNIYSDYRFTPNDQRAVFRVQDTGLGTGDLYMVRPSGSPVVRLTTGFNVPGAFFSDWFITPDGRHAVFYERPSGSPVTELYSVTLAVDPIVTRLNGPLVPGGAVSGGTDLGARLTYDATQVVYHADQDVDGVFQLYVVPVDGSAPPALLDDGPRPGRLVTSFRPSPADGQAYFVGDEDVPTVQELFRLPLAGATPAVRINASLFGLETGDVSEFRASPDGMRVVYLADQEVEDRLELYSARTDGSEAPVKLNMPLAPGEIVGDFVITQDGRHVAFRVARPFPEEIFTVPIDGSAPPVGLHPGLTAAVYSSSPDGGSVVYLAAAQGTLWINWFAAPADGSSPEVQLSTFTAGSPAIGSSTFSRDGSTFLYYGVQSEGLFAVPVDGSSAPQELSGAALSIGATVAATKDDQALFSARVAPGVYEILMAPLDGSLPPVQISEPSVDGVASAVPFQLVPDDERVVYRKNGILFVRPLDRSVLPVRLNGPELVGEFVVDPLGQRVAYASPPGLSDSVYTTPLTHSAPVRVSDPVGPFEDVLELAFTPNGRRVLLRATVPLPGNPPGQVTGLVSAPSATAGGALRLDEVTQADGGVISLEISADPRRIVYLADEKLTGRYQVYEVPSDGHARRTRLSSSPTSAATPFLAPDGSRVAYLGDDLVAGRSEVLVHLLGPGPFVLEKRRR